MLENSLQIRPVLLDQGASLRFFGLAHARGAGLHLWILQAECQRCVAYNLETFSSLETHLLGHANCHVAFRLWVSRPVRL